MEVWKNVLVLFLVVLRLQLEDGRDELGETEQLSYDGIASAHQLQDGLATVVLRREKVLGHCEACAYTLKISRCEAICLNVDERRDDGEVLLRGAGGGGALVWGFPHYACAMTIM